MIEAQTQQVRKRRLLSLYAEGQRVYWELALALAFSEHAKDWCEYKSQWEWWCALLDKAGYAVPDQSQYHSFRMQVRVGHFALRCLSCGISQELLIPVGRAKADILARTTKDLSPKDLKAEIRLASARTKRELQNKKKARKPVYVWTSLECPCGREHRVYGKVVDREIGRGVIEHES